MNESTEQKALPSRIAVIASSGGSEHAVSLRSADNVCAALQQSFANIQIFSFDADLENALLAWERRDLKEREFCPTTFHEGGIAK